MNDDPNCPECATPLRSSLHPAGPGEYATRWTCPNAANHGTTVPCQNDCGEQVRNPREHYWSVPGLIGSGRWTCLPKTSYPARAPGSSGGGTPIAWPPDLFPDDLRPPAAAGTAEDPADPTDTDRLLAGLRERDRTGETPAVTALLDGTLLTVEEGLRAHSSNEQFPGQVEPECYEHDDAQTWPCTDHTRYRRILQYLDGLTRATR